MLTLFYKILEKRVYFLLEIFNVNKIWKEINFDCIVIIEMSTLFVLEYMYREKDTKVNKCDLIVLLC